MKFVFNIISFTKDPRLPKTTRLKHQFYIKFYSKLINLLHELTKNSKKCKFKIDFKEPFFFCTFLIPFSKLKFKHQIKFEKNYPYFNAIFVMEFSIFLNFADLFFQPTFHANTTVPFRIMTQRPDKITISLSTNFIGN